MSASGLACAAWASPEGAAPPRAGMCLGGRFRPVPGTRPRGLLLALGWRSAVPTTAWAIAAATVSSPRPDFVVAPPTCCRGTLPAGIPRLELTASTSAAATNAAAPRAASVRQRKRGLSSRRASKTIERAGRDPSSEPLADARGPCGCAWRWFATSASRISSATGGRRSGSQSSGGVRALSADGSASARTSSRFGSVSLVSTESARLSAYPEQSSTGSP